MPSLIMQELGVSMGIVLFHLGINTMSQQMNPLMGCQKHSYESEHSCRMEGVQPNLESLNPNVNDCCSVEKSQQLIPDLVEDADINEAAAAHVDDLNCSRKRQKLDAPREEQDIATESSILSWLDNFRGGVSLSDILKHFNGSKEESIMDLLRHLERKRFWKNS